LRRGGLGQDAANDVGDLIGNDAQLVLRFEETTQTVVKERYQFFGGETELFCELEDPDFSRSQFLPFRRGTFPHAFLA